LCWGFSSLLRRAQGRRAHARFAEEVRRFDERTDAYAALHRDDCIVVRYDEYIRDLTVLGPLFERLGATPDSAALQQVLSKRLDH
jgi:hypothetical protein